MKPDDADADTGPRSADPARPAVLDLPEPEMVTVTIRHEPRVEAHPEYEAWLNRIIPVAARFPGHRGVSVIRTAPGARVYTVILRFDHQQHVEDWLRSDARRHLLDEVAPLLLRAEELNIVSGLEFWFEPDAAPQTQARRYKQFLVTLSVIEPMTLLVPWVLARCSRRFHGVPTGW